MDSCGPLPAAFRHCCICGCQEWESSQCPEAVQGSEGIGDHICRGTSDTAGQNGPDRGMQGACGLSEGSGDLPERQFLQRVFRAGGHIYADSGGWHADRDYGLQSIPCDRRRGLQNKV